MSISSYSSFNATRPNSVPPMLEQPFYRAQLDGWVPVIAHPERNTVLQQRPDVLAFLIGPVFFTIIQTSIERGFGSGTLVAVGVSLSDAFYITLTYLGIYQLFDKG